MLRSVVRVHPYHRTKKEGLPVRVWVLFGHDRAVGLENHAFRMRAQPQRAGTPAPKAIGLDEISIRKRHVHRIVVSDLVRGRPIWSGGEDRSKASMAQFYMWRERRGLGAERGSRTLTGGYPGGF